MPALALCALLAATGCVRRTLVITSEPDDARVLLDGRTIGRTPLEVPFTWYGRREVMLFKEGADIEIVEREGADPNTYRLATQIELVRPAYQAPGAEVVSDLLYPGTIEDRQEFHFVLEPVDRPEGAAADVAGEALLDRGLELRERAQAPAPDRAGAGAP